MVFTVPSWSVRLSRPRTGTTKIFFSDKFFFFPSHASRSNSPSVFQRRFAVHIHIPALVCYLNLRSPVSLSCGLDGFWHSVTVGGGRVK